MRTDGETHHHIVINEHDQAPPPATRRRLDPFGVDNGRLLNEFLKCMTSTFASPP